MGRRPEQPALVSGERPEAPAMGMRLEEKKKKIRLFCTRKMYQVVPLLMLICLLQERATGGVTHSPSIWGFNCKLS